MGAIQYTKNYFVSYFVLVSELPTKREIELNIEECRLECLRLKNEASKLTSENKVLANARESKIQDCKNSRNLVNS